MAGSDTRFFPLEKPQPAYNCSRHPAIGCRKEKESGLALPVPPADFLQFHQSLCCPKDTHEGRNQLGKVSCRNLYLIDQLQESRHASEAQTAGTHANGRPKESHEIT